MFSIWILNSLKIASNTVRFLFSPLERLKMPDLHVCMGLSILFHSCPHPCTSYSSAQSVKEEYFPIKNIFCLGAWGCVCVELY